MEDSHQTGDDAQPISPRDKSTQALIVFIYCSEFDDYQITFYVEGYFGPLFFFATTDVDHHLLQS